MGILDWIINPIGKAIEEFVIKPQADPDGYHRARGDKFNIDKMEWEEKK